MHLMKVERLVEPLEKQSCGEEAWGGLVQTKESSGVIGGRGTEETGEGRCNLEGTSAFSGQNTALNIVSWGGGGQQ